MVVIAAAVDGAKTLVANLYETYIFWDIQRVAHLFKCENGFSVYCEPISCDSLLGHGLKREDLMHVKGGLIVYLMSFCS